jgi:hypothetical protein
MEQEMPVLFGTMVLYSDSPHIKAMFMTKRSEAMKRLFRVAAAVALLAINTISFADELPADVISKFILAGKSNEIAVMYRCFSYTNSTDAESTDQRENIVKAFTSPTFHAEITQSFVTSSCAIVMMRVKDENHPGAPKYNGLSLVRRVGKWLILPDSAHDNIKNPLNALSESEAEAFKQLHQVSRDFQEKLKYEPSAAASSKKP